MLHGFHFFPNICAVWPTGKKIRLGIKRTFPSQSQTRDGTWGRPFGLSGDKLESVEAGSTFYIRRGAGAGPTLCQALCEEPGAVR